MSVTEHALDSVVELLMLELDVKLKIEQLNGETNHLYSGKAPGSDGITGEIIKAVQPCLTCTNSSVYAGMRELYPKICMMQNYNALQEQRGQWEIVATFGEFCFLL